MSNENKTSAATKIVRGFMVVEYPEHIVNNTHTKFGVCVCDADANGVPGRVVCRGNNKLAMEVIVKALHAYGADSLMFQSARPIVA